MLGQLFAAHCAFASSDDVENIMAIELENYGGIGLEIDTVQVSRLVMKSFDQCDSVAVRLMAPIRDVRRPRYRISCEESNYSRVVSGMATGRFKGLIATIDINRGMTVLGSDVSEQVLSLSAFRPGALAKKNDVFGRVVKSNISKGSLIRDSHLQPRYDILNGQVVTVILRTGNIEYADEAVATQSGRVGDRIMVMNKNSKKTYRAVITDKGEVGVSLR